VTAFLAGLVLLFGPPSPVLSSQGEQVTAARGSYCWGGEPKTNALKPWSCADAPFGPPATSRRSLPVGSAERVGVDTRTDADSLTARLRGRSGKLAVTAVAGSRRQFVVRLPRHVGRESALDLDATYPEGSGSFAVRLSGPGPSAPPRPVLRAGHRRLKMARGSYCWSRPPVGLCVDTKPPATKRALKLGARRQVRANMRLPVTLVAASIRGGARDLPVQPIGAGKRRFLVLLPQQAEGRVVLDLFARYPQGDGSFGARLRLRR